MIGFKQILRPIIFIGVALALMSCGRVPKEVVELSYRTGEDLASME